MKLRPEGKRERQNRNLFDGKIRFFEVRKDAAVATDVSEEEGTERSTNFLIKGPFPSFLLGARVSVPEKEGRRSSLGIWRRREQWILWRKGKWLYHCSRQRNAEKQSKKGTEANFGMRKQTEIKSASRLKTIMIINLRLPWTLQYSKDAC